MIKKILAIFLAALSCGLCVSCGETNEFEENDKPYEAPPMAGPRICFIS